MKKLLIIGGGPAGNAAALAAGAGPVALVERDAFGGTCTNRGCIPTKFLLAKSESLQAQGVSQGGFQAEWGRLIAHKSALVGGLSKSIEARCAAKGVEVIRGSAQFVGPHAVLVSLAGKPSRIIEAEQVIVATGSAPSPLPGAPFDGESVISSTDALDLKQLPDSLAVIGSGAVGSEFATLYARIGVRVTLVEAAERLFPAEDPDVGRLFKTIYERMGISISTGDPVLGVERRRDGVAILLKSGAVIQAEKALVAIGRHLQSDGLDCQAAGVSTGLRGALLVDDELRTSQPHIRAAGDVTGRMLLAHAASYMGEFAARRALGLPFGPVPYHSIPWATFTMPEVAGVGLSLESALREGRDCVANSIPLMESVKARIHRTTEGFVKVVHERGSGRLTGATVVGPHASDIIHVLALAIHKGMTTREMRGFCFVHPSISEIISDLFASLE